MMRPNFIIFKGKGGKNGKKIQNIHFSLFYYLEIERKLKFVKISYCFQLLSPKWSKIVKRYKMRPTFIIFKGKDGKNGKQIWIIHFVLFSAFMKMNEN